MRRANRDTAEAALPRADPLARPPLGDDPMFRAFYGKAADIGPMLEHRGLSAEGADE
jgi:hypothetical protein